MPIPGIRHRPLDRYRVQLLVRETLTVQYCRRPETFPLLICVQLITFIQLYKTRMDHDGCRSFIYMTEDPSLTNPEEKGGKGKQRKTRGKDKGKAQPSPPLLLLLPHTPPLVLLPPLSLELLGLRRETLSWLLLIAVTPLGSVRWRFLLLVG